MSLILNIDTALETASVCLAKDGNSIGYKENNNQKDHSAWLHPAIEELLKETNTTPLQLDAIAVNIGPGSYTGLRVGLSAAKGLCYALHKPLVTINSLELTAFAAQAEATAFICPVIDARRMEVFFAVYDKQVKQLQNPAALIVNSESFIEFLNQGAVLFCGTGSKKLQAVINHPNAVFSSATGNALLMSGQCQKKYLTNEIASLTATDPLYIKDFYTPGQKG
jgi:tRNA threonylcarbamoyladenosine biosynthesis protein TsaB